jgi:Inner membrane protein YgaP-like, transmembrane domain
MLKKNVGSLDRILRFILGVVLLGAFFLLPDASYRYWLLIGIIPLGTSLVSSCPIYSVLGLSTCPLKKS